MRARHAIAIALIGALAAGPGVAVAGPPALSAHSAILVDATTGQPLYGAHADQQRPIASTTKLMTALIVLEHAKLDTVFTHPNYYSPAVDSQIGLRPGERMTVADLLTALLLPSADDAAEDLAFNVGHGSVGRFIGMMNARARELHLTHTHYSTPIGLDTPGNYSSASDLVRLAGFLLHRHPFFRHTVARPVARLKSGDHQRVVANRNTLVGHVPWINGVKTGHTLGAGYVLVGSGTQGRLTLISAVLGTPSEAARNHDTWSLLSYGFTNFRLEQPIKTGQVLVRLPVKDQPNLHAAVVASSTYEHVVARGTPIGIRLELPRRLTGPIRAGTVVGTAVVTARGRVLARIPVRVARSIPAVSTLTLIGRFFKRPTTLLFVAVFLVASVVLVVRRRARSKVRETRRLRVPA